jgi:hypothetical protein
MPWSRPCRGLALCVEQRAHGLRRYLRTAAADEPDPADEADDSRTDIERALQVLADAGGCADDDFDDVSALRASMADDAAPRAKNMAELQQGRAMAADSCSCPSSASAVPMQKNPIKPGFPASDSVRQTRQ